jgi:hypothetical protein
MPPQTHTNPAPAEEFHAPAAAPAAVSRRSLLRGAAGAGAVGLAATAGAGAVVAATRPSAPPDPPPASRPVAMSAMPPAAMAGPLVVYIADTTTGQFDVFGGTGQVRVRNAALVRQLLANLKLA